MLQKFYTAFTVLMNFSTAHDTSGAPLESFSSPWLTQRI